MSGKPLRLTRTQRRPVRRRGAEFDERQLSLILEARSDPRRRSAKRESCTQEPAAATGDSVPVDEKAIAQRPCDPGSRLSPESDKILRLPEVKAATGRGRSAIYEGMANGTFPRSRKIGARAVGWYASDIQHWLDDRPRTQSDPAGSA